MNPLIAIALALWATIGPFAAPAISIVQSDNHRNDALYASTTHVDSTHCTIAVGPLFNQLPVNGDPAPPYMATQQLILDHEVGLCVGLSETGDGIMNHYGGQRLTNSDIMEFLRVHPLPARAHVVVN